MYFFARSPIPQLRFSFIWLKYKSELRCLFIVNPRYLTCVVREIYVPLILKFGYFVMFLSDLALNNKMSVLLVLKDILFALSHVVRTFKPWLISLFIIFKELSTTSKYISSAKWCTLLNFMAWWSLMYIKKSSGSRTESCRTSKSIKVLSDVWSFTVTCCFLLVRFF